MIRYEYRFMMEKHRNVVAFTKRSQMKLKMILVSASLSSPYIHVAYQIRID